MVLDILLNPIVIVCVILSGVVIFLLINKKDSWKDFKPQEFDKTLKDNLNEKLKTYGKPIKGDLFVGYYKIAKLRKYMIVKGKFLEQIYNQSSKELVIPKDPNKIDYDFLILETKRKGIIQALFGKSVHYILDLYNKDGKKIIDFGKEKNNVIIPENLPYEIYGKIWIISDLAIEYLNDISMKRMNEQTMMHLENLPDKVAHLEMQQAKRERSERIFAEMERAKWEKRKDASDTTVS